MHSSAQPITEENVKKVVSAAGGQVEEIQVKALVAALQDVNIDDALKSATSFAPVAAPAVATPAESKKKEEKPAEDEKKKEEEALAGLGALFG